jgi:methyl-accepting chemotaxis protein
VVAPETWAGVISSTHIHVYTALVLGGIITAFPVFLGFFQPGRTLTRHVMAASQMMMSAMLIHLSGGRIETHFQVFGLLAFIAFYRDWKVLVTATVVVAGDHLIRGIFWPQSVFGVITASEWRVVEHAAWVVFEDVFLFISCMQQTREMNNIAEQRALLETTNEEVEALIDKLQVEKKAREERQIQIEKTMRASENQQIYLNQCVDEMLAGMNQFASGDLSVNLEPRRDDAMAKLYQGFNDSVLRFKRLLERVTRSIEVSTLTTHRIAEAAHTISTSAREQAVQSDPSASCASVVVCPKKY